MPPARLHLLTPLALLAIGLIAASCGNGPRNGNGTASTFNFVDANGDLVCDTPGDPARQLDPEKLIFAYTPLEDPAGYRELWQGFLDHLGATTGKPVEFFSVPDGAAQLEALRSGQLHVTGVNTGNVPVAVRECGFVPAFMMAAGEDRWGYEMEIISQADSGIRTVPDLRGCELALTNRGSNSGFKAPTVLLHRDFEFDVEQDPGKLTFSGGHEESILGVARGDFDAAAVANSVLRRMIHDGDVQADAFTDPPVYRSMTFPTTGYGWVCTLRPSLQDRIAEAFRTFDWEGSALKTRFAPNGWTTFIPITYKKHWKSVRDIDALIQQRFGDG